MASTGSSNNNSSDNEHMRRTVRNLLAGTMAGVGVVLVGHPFDTLKVRMRACVCACVRASLRVWMCACTLATTSGA